MPTNRQRIETILQLKRFSYKGTYIDELKKLQDGGPTKKLDYTGMGIGFVNNQSKPKFIGDTIGPRSVDSMLYTDKELKNAKIQKDLADIATGVATWGTQYSPPSERQLEQGRKGGLDRLMLEANSATYGLANDLVGYGMSKLADKIVSTGVDWAANSKELYKKISKEPERVLSSNERELLQEELDRRGILKVQETPNLPGKEYIRKTLYPFGYNIKSKIKTLIPGTTNNTFSKESYNEATRILKDIKDNKGTSREFKIGSLKSSMANANRYDTWNMYLGNPQITGENQLYNISPRSTNKQVVYTHNSNRMLNKRMAADYVNSIIDEKPILSSYGDEYVSPVKTTPVLPTSNYRVPSVDSYLYGTMGGFGYDVEKVANKNRLIATDLWDLQPLSSAENLPFFMKKKIEVQDPVGMMPEIVPNALGAKFKNIELGKTLGIGKPIQVMDEFNNKIYGSPDMYPYPIYKTKDLAEKMKLENPNMRFKGIHLKITNRPIDINSMYNGINPLINKNFYYYNKNSLKEKIKTLID